VLAGVVVALDLTLAGVVLVTGVVVLLGAMGNEVVGFSTVVAAHLLITAPMMIQVVVVKPREPTDDQCHVSSVPPRNLYPGFEAQTREPTTDDFEAQTTKSAVTSVLYTCPPLLDMCYRRYRSIGRPSLARLARLLILVTHIKESKRNNPQEHGYR